MEAVVFSGAVISLFVALLAAVVSFGGLQDASAAATAWHVYLIAMGLFVVTSVVAILDLQPANDIRTLFARGSRRDSER
ncbi:MAG TPA: hypothetical protein VJK90_09600 [Acetobacteraceae bacterium]|jgi:hypothetical protein|nr:hypothetical protein [Acetobacteraceae bacterium]